MELEGATLDMAGVQPMATVCPSVSSGAGPSQLSYTSQSLRPVMVNAGDVEFYPRPSEVVVVEPEDAADNNQFTQTVRLPVKAQQPGTGLQQQAHQRSGEDIKDRSDVAVADPNRLPHPPTPAVTAAAATMVQAATRSKLTPLSLPTTEPDQWVISQVSMQINHSLLLAGLAAYGGLQLTRSACTESAVWQGWEDEQQAATPTKSTLKAPHPLLEEQGDGGRVGAGVERKEANVGARLQEKVVRLGAVEVLVEQVVVVAMATGCVPSRLCVLCGGFVFSSKALFIGRIGRALGYIKCCPSMSLSHSSPSQPSHKEGS